MLSISDFIFCENRNHSNKLLSKLGIKKKLIPLHDHNEKDIIDNYAEKIKDRVVSLISDAGSPLISDPGFKFVSYCIKKKIFVTTIPGPSSVISALQLSSLPPNQFVFWGFAPKNKKGIIGFLSNVYKETKTSIIFVSSHRIKVLLELLEQNIPERKISVCKEITKINEKSFIGTPKEVVKGLESNPKYMLGEFVVVIEGIKDFKKNKFDEIGLEITAIIKKLLKKFSLTETVEIVHKISYIEKNKIYKKALDIKNDK